MSSLFSSRGSGSSALSGSQQEEKKQQVMNEVRNQLALANAQELINKMNEKCFAKCVTKPSEKLTPNEEGCIMRCMDRYLEAFNVVSSTYVKRVGKEREAANAALPGGELGGASL
ncbi:hypothetical protein ACM66B_006855 [Microbotryomycetes sp. NB124-2]